MTYTFDQLMSGEALVEHNVRKAVSTAGHPIEDSFKRLMARDAKEKFAAKYGHEPAAFVEAEGESAWVCMAFDP